MDQGEAVLKRLCLHRAPNEAHQWVVEKRRRRRRRSPLVRYLMEANRYLRKFLPRLVFIKKLHITTVFAPLEDLRFFLNGDSDTTYRRCIRADTITNKCRRGGGRRAPFLKLQIDALISPHCRFWWPIFGKQDITSNYREEKKKNGGKRKPSSSSALQCRIQSGEGMSKK